MNPDTTTLSLSDLANLYDLLELSFIYKRKIITPVTYGYYEDQWSNLFNVNLKTWTQLICIPYLWAMHYMHNTTLGIIVIHIDVYYMNPAYDLVRKLWHKTKVKKKCKYLITYTLKIEVVSGKGLSLFAHFCIIWIFVKLVLFLQSKE